jgi:hypothetical protein
MKKLIFAIIAVCLMAVFSIGQSPFEFYQGEICEEGTDVINFQLNRPFTTGLLIRFNIVASPSDTLADTVKAMLATRFSYPNQTGMEALTLPQAWSTFTDSFLTATTDTATVELWFPKDSLITGYDGTTLGNLLRLTLTSTDSLYSGITGAWCDSLDTSLKWQLAIGYF